MYTVLLSFVILKKMSYWILFVVFRIDDSLSDIYGELQQQQHQSNLTAPRAKPKPNLPPKPVIMPKPTLLPGESSASNVKPTPSPRPQSLSSRPVPPPRTTLITRPQPATRNISSPKKDVSGPNPMLESSTDTGNAAPSIDILSYIKSEEDVQNQNLDLFE